MGSRAASNQTYEIENIQLGYGDINFDELILRKQRLEFYLLTSLGTRTMFKWLPASYTLDRYAKTIELGGISIVIKSHVLRIPLMKEMSRNNQEFAKTIRQLKQMTNTAAEALRIMKIANGNDAISDSFYEQSKLLEALNTMLKEKIKAIAAQPPSVCCYVGETIVNGLKIDHRIFDAFVRANPRFNEVGAIEHLESIFDCKGESVWSPVRIDRRSNWRRRFPGISNWDTRISNDAGIKLFLGLPPSYTTTWERIGDHRPYCLSVVSDPLPIWCQRSWQHLPEVALTENLLYANNYQLINGQHPVCSWLGRADSIPFVDWQKFKNKRVYYLLLTREKSYLETAAKVKNALSGIASEVIFLGVPKQQNPNPYGIPQIFTEISLWSFERWLGNNISNFPVTLSNKNEPKKRQSSASYLVVNSTDSTPVVSLQAPFPISSGSISLLYSEAGVGKTWFAMCYAYALSIGKPFCSKWKSNKKLAVLYLDGEMGKFGLEDRLQHIERVYGVKLKENNNFHCLALNSAEIDIATLAGQHEIDTYIAKNINSHGKKEIFIVIDNILSVTRYSDHPAHWNSIFSWVKDLRDHDHATILFIHHSNKAGDQRGSAIKTAVVDNVIRVKRLPEGGGGMGMSLQFEKHRFIAYNDYVKFDLSLKIHNKNPHWVDHNKYKAIKDLKLLIKMLQENGHRKPLPIKDIMEKTGYSRPAIYLKNKSIKLNREPTSAVLCRIPEQYDNF